MNALFPSFLFEKAKKVFYASINAGKITGAEGKGGGESLKAPKKMKNPTTASVINPMDSGVKPDIKKVAPKALDKINNFLLNK